MLDSCRNILAILEDLPSLKPPVDHLCELLPRLQARYYSIASSSKVSHSLKKRFISETKTVNDWRVFPDNAKQYVAGSFWLVG